MPDTTDRDGRTPLRIATFEGRAADVRSLLDSGADVNAADSGGRTALHFAAQEYRMEEAALLCGAGATVDARDRFGNTARWRATFESRGSGDLIRLLLSNGADPDASNDSGVTPGNWPSGSATTM